MADSQEQKIIETFNKSAFNDAAETSLPAPSLKNTRVRAHFECGVINATLADNVLIDLRNFPKEAEFNIRPFGERGIVISVKNPTTNSVLELVYDNAKDVKQVNVSPDGVNFSHVLLNKRTEIGSGSYIFTFDKNPIPDVQKQFKEAIEKNGFKVYEEDPAVDKKRGVSPPQTIDPAKSAQNTPLPGISGKGIEIA